LNELDENSFLGREVPTRLNNGIEAWMRRLEDEVYVVFYTISVRDVSRSYYNIDLEHNATLLLLDRSHTSNSIEIKLLQLV